MSQRPKAGAPARAASASKVTPKEVPNEVVAAAASAAARPVADTPAAKSEPVANAEPVKVETAAKSEPMVMAEPAVEEEPVTGALPMPEVEPVVKAEPETAITAPASVDEPLAAAPDLTGASAEAISGTITATADTVAAAAGEVVETAASIKPTRPTITQGMKTMMKTTEDFVAFGQANLEAFVKSGQIWSAGVQELTKQIATSAKASFDESVSTFKAISTAKSVKEAMDLQSTFAKAALEKAMAESNKLTDASIKLTEQTLAPITARVTVAVETFGKAA